jgi:hypothetical protein
MRARLGASGTPHRCGCARWFACRVLQQQPAVCLPAVLLAGWQLGVQGRGKQIATRSGSAASKCHLVIGC